MDVQRPVYENLLECNCGTAPRGHNIGAHPDCEYSNHHCDECHKLRVCTKAACGMFRRRS